MLDKEKSERNIKGETEKETKWETEKQKIRLPKDKETQRDEVGDRQRDKEK